VTDTRGKGGRPPRGEVYELLGDAVDIIEELVALVGVALKDPTAARLRLACVEIRDRLAEPGD
jgi:hypothetical protein